MEECANSDLRHACQNMSKPSRQGIPGCPLFPCGSHDHFSSLPVVTILPILLILFVGSAQRAIGDPGPPPIVDPNQTRFPRSSLVDFSYMLDAPAGRHGFLETRDDGQFYFSDGTQSRFWGVNIASRSVFQPPATIDQVVDVIARSGFNLVRIHHIDERNGIVDLSGSDTRHFNATRLQLLDYWIARLKARGIYVYLDLIDYRTFKPGDGVENAEALGRGAKPYALFNRPLIELQKEYARKLLVEHINPFTGLSYAQDPAVVMLELFDENGLFMKRHLWRLMPEPYGTEFKLLWNEWLRTQYASTEKLSRTWTNSRGEKALMPSERLENNSIELPEMKLAGKDASTYARSLDSPARRNDAARFAYDVQRRYFSEMRSYLRGLGVRIPLTAVTRSDDIPDLKSVADELDFIGNNFYWDHPFWKAGNDWQPPFYFLSHNPLSEPGNNAFAPSVMLSKVRNIPLFVREWEYCWPNRYRAAGMLEAVAYACLQDVNAMILFTLGTHEDANKLEFFDCHLDPVRWGLTGVAAKAFIQRDISPADFQVDVAYTQTDAFTYSDYASEVYRLGFVSRVQNALFDAAGRITGGDGGEAPTLRIASGRSATGRYDGAKNLIRCNDQSVDLYDRARKPTSEALEAYGILAFPGQSVSTRTFAFDGVFLTVGRKELSTQIPFAVEVLSDQKLNPIGVTPDGRHAFGFFDPARKNFVFSRLAEGDAVRVALDAIGFLHGKKISRQTIDSGELMSDNGQIRRNTKTGRMAISTPRFCALAGMLKGAREVQVGTVNITPSSEVGVIVVSSLDLKPLDESRRIHVKCVSNAANTGQKDVFQGWYGRYQLETTGSLPIQTFGSISTQPTRIDLGNGRGIEVYQENGTWELLMEFDKSYFFTDTPGAPVKILGISPTARVISYGYDESRQVFTYGTQLTYPANTALVSVE